MFQMILKKKKPRLWSVKIVGFGSTSYYIAR